MVLSVTSPFTRFLSYQPLPQFHQTRLLTNLYESRGDFFHPFGTARRLCVDFWQLSAISLIWQCGTILR